MWRHQLTLAAIAVACIYSGELAAQPADPINGTWELNVAKSRFDPGPAPRSQTRTYESDGKVVRMTSTSVNVEGQVTEVEYTAGYDGKDAPINSPIADSISLKRIDDSTSEATLKKDGKVVSTSTRVVSKDGKEMTVTTTGKNEKGQTIRSELLFERK